MVDALSELAFAWAAMVGSAVVRTIVMSPKGAGELAQAALRATKLDGCLEIDCKAVERAMQPLDVCMSRGELSRVRADPSSHMLNPHVDHLIQMSLKLLNPLCLDLLEPVLVRGPR